MTKRSTKNALLSSVVALLLCCSMLIGTTFAWFTDSVTSANNIIKAGTLDITMEWADGTKAVPDVDSTDWKDASEGAIFNSKLWEPGYTEVRHIKIANEGTLALKYQLRILANGEVSELADVIDVYYIDPAEQINDRTQLTNKLGTLTEVLAGLEVSGNGVLVPAGKEGDGYQSVETVTIALKMQETAGNKYQDKKIGSDFSIQLLATQYTYENDSFNAQYDADASLDFYAVSSLAELKLALANKVKKITLTADVQTDAPLNVDYDATIIGAGYTISRTSGYTGTVITVKGDSTVTLENITVDGGAVWSGEMDPTLQRGTTNTGVTATGSLIATENNSDIILNDGAILQNNVGAYAVNLGTRIGATLTLNGGQIINNESEAGAIWGGGDITVNSGKINGNSSTGIAGAIRMVSNCNLTVNGGEINHNKAAGDGGVIWGYGSSTYTFDGGEMAYNESVGTGGAIYTGNSSVINISGDFEMHDNKAADSGAIRLTSGTSLTMNGGKIYNNTQNGESNAFNTWNNPMSITGGSISDDFSYVGGVGLTIGAADIDGVISYNLATNHNTAYLAAEFNAFAFTVNEEATNFSNFNFKPANGYVYVGGDEAKLVCLNEGYSTYWDAATGTFRLKAD